MKTPEKNQFKVGFFFRFYLKKKKKKKKRVFANFVWRSNFFNLGTSTFNFSQQWFSHCAKIKHRQSSVKHCTKWIRLVAIFYTMTFYNYKKSLGAKGCRSSLLSVFHKVSPFTATVGNWFYEFSRGQQSTDDEPHPSHPATTVTQENINPMRKRIKEDIYSLHFVTFKGPSILDQQQCKSSFTIVCLTKRCAYWVLYFMTESEKKVRIDWCHFMVEKLNGGQS